MGPHKLILCAHWYVLKPGAIQNRTGNFHVRNRVFRFTVGPRQRDIQGTLHYIAKKCRTGLWSTRAGVEHSSSWQTGSFLEETGEDKV